MLGTTTRNDLLRLIYNATAIGNLADNAATSPLTQIAVALHTADPGTGTMATSEVAYTGYARVNVARTTGGWTVTANSVSPFANVDFGQRTDNGAQVVATHFSTGFTGGGAAKILDRGVIGSFAGAGSAVVSGNLFTVPAHGLVADDRVCFYAAGSSALPGGVTEGTVYFVRTGTTTDTFTVATTQGGASITLLTAGDFLAYKVTPLFINQNSIPRLTTATAITIE